MVGSNTTQEETNVYKPTVYSNLLNPNGNIFSSRQLQQQDNSGSLSYKSILPNNNNVNSRNVVREPKKFPVTELNNTRKLRKQVKISPYLNGSEGNFDLTGGCPSHQTSVTLPNIISQRDNKNTEALNTVRTSSFMPIQA